MTGFLFGAGLMSALAAGFVLWPFRPLPPLRRTADAIASTGRPYAAVLALAVPLLAVSLYSLLGQPATWISPLADRHREAAQLLEQAVKLATEQEQRFDGEPARLIQQALALEPDNAQALALAGAARFERKDYAGAAALWRQVLAQARPESAEAQTMRVGIAKAEALAGQTDAEGP